MLEDEEALGAFLLPTEEIEVGEFGLENEKAVAHAEDECQGHNDCGSIIGVCRDVNGIKKCVEGSPQKAQERDVGSVAFVHLTNQVAMAKGKRDLAAKRKAAGEITPFIKWDRREYCSGNNLDVGDLWSAGLADGAAHCPKCPAGGADACVLQALKYCGTEDGCAGFTQEKIKGDWICFRSMIDYFALPGFNACYRKDIRAEKIVKYDSKDAVRTIDGQYGCGIQQSVWAVDPENGKRREGWVQRIDGRMIYLHWRGTAKEKVYVQGDKVFERALPYKGAPCFNEFNDAFDDLNKDKEPFPEHVYNLLEDGAKCSGGTQMTYPEYGSRLGNMNMNRACMNVCVDADAGYQSFSVEKVFAAKPKCFCVTDDCSSRSSGSYISWTIKKKASMGAFLSSLGGIFGR